MKILIIDGHRSRRALLKKCLESENCRVDLAFDGERGSYFARTNNYDVVLLSCEVKKKSAIQVCVEIRGSEKSSFILAYSKNNDCEHRIQLYLAGIDDVLLEPFSFRELVVRMRSLLRRGPMIRRDVLEVGNLKLDPLTHDVWCGRRKIILPKKAFGILEILMSRCGSIVTRATLIDKVWDMEVDPFSNTIDSHISLLRQKLGRCGPQIRNVHGRGFIIE